MNVTAYLDIDSPIHRWDARWKLVTIAACMFVCASVQKFESLGLILLLSLLLAVFARIPLAALLSAVRRPLAMSALLAPFLCVSAGGDVQCMVAGAPVYAEGVRLSGVIIIRSTAIVIAFAALFISTKHDLLFKALERLYLPKKAVFILMASYRYVFLFMDYFAHTLKAARLRGFSLNRGLLHAKCSLHMLVSLIVRGYDLHEQTAIAMRLRGLGDRIVTRKEFKTTFADIAKSGAIAALGALIMYLETA